MKNLKCCSAVLIAATAALALVPSAHAVTAATGFTPGDLVVLRLGDTTTPGTPGNTAVPVYLDEYSLSNPAGSAPVMTLGPIMTGSSASGAGTSPFTIGSDGDHNATLNLSSDGQSLVFGGYEKSVGGSNPNGDSAAVSPRVVASVGFNGIVNTTTVLGDAFNGLDLRSVASTNGSTFYLGGKGSSDGSGGLRLATLGASTSTSLDPHYANPKPAGTIGTYTDTRDVVITPPINTNSTTGAQLFTPSGSSGNGAYGVGYYGSGLPTTPTAWTPITGFPTTVHVTSLFFADLSSAVPGPDTLYVVTDTTLSKYCLQSNGSWTDEGDLATSVSAEKLTGLQTGNSVNLFYSFEQGNQGIYEVTDAGGYDAGFSTTTLPSTPYIAPAFDTVLRGVAFAPVAAPEPASLGLIGLGAAALIRRRRA